MGGVGLAEEDGSLFPFLRAKVPRPPPPEAPTSLRSSQSGRHLRVLVARAPALDRPFFSLTASWERCSVENPLPSAVSPSLALGTGRRTAASPERSADGPRGFAASAEQRTGNCRFCRFPAPLPPPLHFRVAPSSSVKRSRERPHGSYRLARRAPRACLRESVDRSIALSLPPSYLREGRGSLSLCRLPGENSRPRACGSAHPAFLAVIQSHCQVSWC